MSINYNMTRNLAMVTNGYLISLEIVYLFRLSFLLEIYEKNLKNIYFLK